MIKKYSILVLAIVLMIVGIHNNEVKIVLNKSIKICLECIGIG